MALKLVKGSLRYQDLIVDMLKEWKEYNEINNGNSSPGVIFKNSYEDFKYYLDHLEVKKGNAEGLVCNSVYFCLDEERNVVVGAVDIRHSLNEFLLNYGGHIGDGIRPSERRKGYATKMISLALVECKKFGIDKVLMVCDKDNVGSAKSIINNGGIMENEVLKDGKVLQRYWISL